MWFKVDDSFHSHPKAAAASLAALGLWTVAGSWSGNHLMDGFVPDHMLPLLSRGEVKLADELVNAGLWRRSKGGYRFHEWEQRNPTREQADRVTEKSASGGALGNHLRWHIKKGVIKPDCAFCQDKHGSGTDRGGDQGTDRGANPDPTRPDPKEKPPNPPPAKPAGRGRPTDDPDFDRFWTSYPKKADKGHALDMWRRHVTKGGADPETVIRGAERYRDDPRRKPDYTKNAGTWLNGLCWEDQPVEHTRTSAAWWDN